MKFINSFGLKISKFIISIGFIVLFTTGNITTSLSQNRLEAPESKPAETNNTKWQGTELRFVTDSDYPPFNYFDEDGALTGFNIDLARAVCLELEVRCDIQAKEWSNLIPSLNNNEADAIIASLAIKKDTIQQVAFTESYFRMHARFIIQSDQSFERATPEEFSGYNIGVLTGTAHEAYLKDFFTSSTVTGYKSAEELYEALQTKKVNAIFGDGISMMFWLNGTDSQGCCQYIGGAFTEPRYFGEGVGIAVAKDNPKLKVAINQALERVKKTGRYEELILRYFPLRF